MEKQKAEPLSAALTPNSGSPLAKRSASEALAWWSPQVRDYATIGGSRP
ncbi:MAG: hypothetical protein JRH01_08795 [Deltaproteobacteria bacterium]|nr:hypothetical protein [Deltaproteobacteria bacterium]MBW2396786.1 hypothetical protein [Deltaproteobacteria bacterium]